MPKLVSIGEIIDRSWESYRSSFVDFMSVSGWMLVVALLDVIALAFYPTATKLVSGAPLTALEGAGTALFWIANAVVAPVLGVWTFLAMARLADAKLSGRRLDVKTALRDAWKSFWGAALVSVLVFLVMLGALAIGIVPGMILTVIATATKLGALTALANVLLVAGVVVAAVLTVRWAVAYAFSTYAFAIDGARAKAALTASRSLVTGRFWPVLVRILIPNAVFIVVGIVVGAVLAVVAGMAVSAAAGLNADVQVRLVTITHSIFPAVAAVLVNPAIVLANVIVYRSLKGQ